MSIISNTLLAFSMSADAFAASVTKGVVLQKPRFRDALRIGLIFGIVETITPILGWLIGSAASNFIKSVDHWVAFTILGIIGIKMIYEGLKKEEKEAKESHGLLIIIVTAFGTSIDAMAVGATLAFLDANIWIISLMIGCATFIMTTIGVMTGHYIGLKAGRIAEIIGGLCLISIGSYILFDHLTSQ